MKRWWFIPAGLFLLFLCGLCFFLTTRLLSNRTLTMEYIPRERLSAETAVSTQMPTVPPIKPLSTPTQDQTPAYQSRALLFQASNQPIPGYSKLMEAAVEEGIKVDVIRDRGEFMTELMDPDLDLVIYPADSWNQDGDLRAVADFTNGDGNALLLYDHRWKQFHVEILQEQFGVTVVGAEIINTSGAVPLSNLFPEPLHQLNTFTTGSSWVAARAYLETEAEGEKVYMEDRNGEQRLVFYRNSDGNVAFMLQTPAYPPKSNFFFDDVGIEYGENEEAAVQLLKYLIE